MLDDFDPKEKKAMLIFIALLLLGLVYVSTHNLSWETPQHQQMGAGEVFAPKLEQRSSETYFEPSESTLVGKQSRGE
jgi:hypothetical protein